MDKIIFPSDFKTGDLIFLSYQGVNTILSFNIFGLIWNHVGIILKDEETTYVVEKAFYPSYKEWIIKIPLQKWLTINKYSNLMGILTINKEIPHEIVNDAFLKHKSEFNHTITCHEFAIHILQKAGVYDEMCIPHEYLIYHLLENKIPTKNGYYYGELKIPKF